MSNDTNRDTQNTKPRDQYLSSSSYSLYSAQRIHYQSLRSVGWRQTIPLSNEIRRLQPKTHNLLNYSPSTKYIYYKIQLWQINHSNILKYHMSLLRSILIWVDYYMVPNCQKRSIMGYLITLTSLIGSQLSEFLDVMYTILGLMIKMIHRLTNPTSIIQVKLHCHTN